MSECWGDELCCGSMCGWYVEWCCGGGTFEETSYLVHLREREGDRGAVVCTEVCDLWIAGLAGPNFQ